jgi:hypothetical protein
VRGGVGQVGARDALNAAALVYLHDLTEAATASTLGISLCVVKPHARGGLARLRVVAPRFLDDEPVATRRPSGQRDVARACRREAVPAPVAGAGTARQFRAPVYFTSARSTRQKPNASGSANQTQPVSTNWVQSCPVKPPSYIRFWLKEKSTQGCAFSNHA